MCTSIARRGPAVRAAPAAREQTQMPAPGVPGRVRITEQPVLQIRHGEQQQTQCGQQQDGNGDHARDPFHRGTTPGGCPDGRR
ncbi:hypothetical protein [Streptomyces violaceoruber]|uniref:hypothetical protein n=1 Tax=Streptomyces violaceoruber TaxID=1935 RepID=UPI0004C4C8B6|nr:hypothetical protein [Streptomyces violaceoruber]